MMQAQRNIIVSLILTAGFIIAGCERNDFNCVNCPIENWEQPELLPPITLKYLDSVRTMDPLDIYNIYLPNNLSVNDYLQIYDNSFYNNWQDKMPYDLDSFNLNTYVARLTFLASKLTDRSSFQFPAEGPNKPAQNGLAYVYGSDDFASRRSSLQSGEGKATCSDELYGLDCSGLFYYVMERTGLPFYTIDSLIKPKKEGYDYLKFMFSNAYDYDVVDFGQQPPNFVKPGDIIYWKFSNHQRTGLLGVVIEDQNKELGVLLSTGSAYNDCERNFSPFPDTYIQRGPRLLILKKSLPLLTNSFLYLNGVLPADDIRGEPGSTSTQVSYSIIRVMPSFSGTYPWSQQYYISDFNNCEYHHYLTDINLSLDYHNNDRLDVEVFAELSYTNNVIGQNCSYIQSDLERKTTFTIVNNSYIDLDFGIGRFTGILKDNEIVGDIKITVIGGLTYTAPMVLYPK